MKKMALVLIALVAITAMASAEGYEKGKTIVGPLLGINWYNFAIGAQGEYGFHENISGGGLFSYSSESYETWGLEDYSVTYIAFGGQANYHFKPGQKFDPFAGVVLGYEVASVDWPAAYDAYWSYWGEPTYGGPFFGGNLGCNYDLSPTMLGRAQVGYPYYIAVGVSFKF